MKLPSSRYHLIQIIPLLTSHWRADSEYFESFLRLSLEKIITLGLVTHSKEKQFFKIEEKTYHKLLKKNPGNQSRTPFKKDQNKSFR